MQVDHLNEVRAELINYVESFSSQLGRSERRHWCGVYLSGLILDGERKSIEPISKRVNGGDEQSLQQFVNQSPWCEIEMQKALRLDMKKRFRLKKITWVLDDSSLPKKGKCSVGVAHQYCGALGKISNCQSIVSFQGVSGRAHFPLAARLYLPKDWTEDVARMDKAKIPQVHREFKEKWRIALDLLDESREDLDLDYLTTDAGYGANREFLCELDNRDVPFVVYTKAENGFWPIDTEIAETSESGRPRKHEIPKNSEAKSMRAHEWGKLLFSHHSNVKNLVINHQKPVRIEYVAIKVKDMIRGSSKPRIGKERWLIIERLKDGTFKYIVSNAVSEVPEELLKVAHQRYKVEQGYQHLKEELGLDHFEGRSWRGLHHHITLCFMAYNFLQILARSRSRGKKNGKTH